MRKFLACLALLALGVAPAAAQSVTTPISSLPVAGAVNAATDYGVGIVQQMVGGRPIYVTSRIPVSKLVGPQGASAFITGVNVTSLPPGSAPSGFVSGAFPNYAVNLSLPSGPANVALGSGTFVPGDFVLAGASGYGLVDGGAPGAAAFKPLSFFLQTANNLSDLASPAAARSNLGLAGVAASGSASDLGAGTLPAARLPAFSGDVTTPAGSTATTLAASGVTAGTYGGTTTVPVVTVDAKGRVTAVSSVAAAGTGTVTSVGLSLPAIFGVSGSPVTSSGTLTGTLATQTANAVWAGPASGSAAAPGFRALVPADMPAGLPDGCLRISAQSSTVLALNPYGCSTLTIGGVPRPVTAATCSIASPTASTVYFVYAAWSGTAVTCSFSTTGHITGPDGREYLNASGSANTAQRLVGMVYSTASTSAPLSDTATFRGVLNWFNRRGLGLSASASGVGTSSTTAVYLNAPAVTFLAWGDETYSGAFAGSASNNQANGISYIAYAIDNAGVTVEQTFQPTAANVLGPIGVAFTATLAEGAHTATGAVRTNSAGNSGSWSFTHTGSTRG